MTASSVQAGRCIQCGSIGKLIKTVGLRIQSATKQSLGVISEILIHERVDDRVGDVVGEVHIEDCHVVGDEQQSHEKRRQERHDEHDCHDKQHGGRLQIRHAVQVAFRRYGDRRTCLVPVVPAADLPLLGGPVWLNLRRALHFDRREEGVFPVGAELATTGARRQHEGEALALGVLATGAPVEYGPVDENVENGYYYETDQIEGSVDLLIRVLEICADDELVRLTVTGVNSEDEPTFGKQRT